MSDDQLISVIEFAVCDELRKANNFTTRATVYLRVLRRITDIMQIPWNIIPEIKNMIHLDSELIPLIKSCWHSQIINESDEELEKFIARDYVKHSDMARFINVLNRREMRQTEPRVCKIYEILGMDGFLGRDAKRYVEYLRYSPDEFKGVHVRAVRKLYREHNTDLDQIHTVLQIAYGMKDVEKADEMEMKNDYIKSIGNHLEKIMEWKQQQSQEQTSLEAAGRKRKKTNDEIEVNAKISKKPRKTRAHAKNESNTSTLFTSSDSEQEQTFTDAVDKKRKKANDETEVDISSSKISKKMKTTTKTESNIPTLPTSSGDSESENEED